MLVAAAAFAGRVEASGASLRWMRSVDTRVTGYHLWMRRAGVPYGAPLDVGMPTAAADGSLAYVVAGLTPGQTYHFAVTAYGARGIESGLSQELALGAINPCLVDSCTSPTICEIRTAADGSSCDDGLFCNGIAVCVAGTCQNGPVPSCSDGVACTTDRCDDALARCLHVSQPGCCVVDADCVDTDHCTSAEHCVAGTCVSLAATCPATACADAFCDPQSGCGLMPTPDGVICDESCDPLDTRRVNVSADVTGAALTLRSGFESANTVDPILTGVTIEIADASGSVAYRGSVSGSLLASRSDGTKFRYTATPEDADATGGITSLLLRQRQGAWKLNLRALSPDLDGVLSQPQIAVTVRFGSTCARNPQVACTDQQDRSVCR